MMHDAVRADVLQALVNSHGAAVPVRPPTTWPTHSANFRDILAGITADAPRAPRSTARSRR